MSHKEQIILNKISQISSFRDALAFLFSFGQSEINKSCNTCHWYQVD